MATSAWIKTCATAIATTPWFKDAVHFCDAYDMPAFDPDMAFMSLDDFEPMMRRLLMAPKKSIWVPNPPAE